MDSTQQANYEVLVPFHALFVVFYIEYPVVDRLLASCFITHLPKPPVIPAGCW